MKKILSLLISLSFIIAMLPVSAAEATSNPDCYEISALNEANILSKYSNELSIISNSYGIEINNINANTIPLIKQYVLANLYEFGFQDLATSIDVAIAEYKADIYFSAIPYANNEVIVNYKVTPKTEYAPITARYVMQSANDVTTSRDISVTVSAGFEYKGYTLSTDVTVSSSTSLTGPSRDATLHNGKPASATYLCSVLSGTIVETTWDLKNITTGQITGHFSTTTLQSNSSDLMGVTPYVYNNGGGILYVDSADRGKSSTGKWSSQSTFNDRIINSPMMLMNGMGDKGSGV